LANQVGRKASRYHKANATLGAFCKIPGKLVNIPETVLQPGVHGTHEHTIFQLGEAKVERFQQVRVIRSHDTGRQSVMNER
jgi:hypothetical protein